MRANARQDRPQPSVHALDHGDNAPSSDSRALSLNVSYVFVLGNAAGAMSWDEFGGVHPGPDGN
eukprot:SAG22_NODE_8728_length_634_cov_1.353271_1_plen_63_part_10